MRQKLRLIFPLMLFLLGLSLPGGAQVITTEPQFPTPGSPVTIYFNAEEGTGGLAGYEGDVYAHTGVITDQSQSDADWQYVVADWGENIDKIKMERIEPNRYKLEITPSIREFYGVPEGEQIQQMAFVFRNSDGSLEGKAEGGADIFAEVYQGPFNAAFIAPADSPAYRPVDAPYDITGIASGNNPDTELRLFIDGEAVTTVTDDTLRYRWQPAATGSYALMLTAANGTEQDTARSRIIVYPSQADTDRPAGLQDGITYVDDSTVRLSLFAPHKDFVYVIGDFNKWQPSADYFMHRDRVNADSTYYWIEIDGLTPGREYGFQYLVDGSIRVTDPYVEKVLDEDDDPYIDASTYPDLKPYPSGQTEHLVGVLQPGRQQYEWQHDNYDRPEAEELVVYELLIRDFVEDHDYQTLTDSLDYLQRLGVNAIELMPVMEFEGNSSWGYNPALLFAPDKYYGPARDLKKFIDEAHARGMAVILDIVLNHVYGQSPLVRLWNEGTFGQPTPENPYLNVQSPNQTYSWGYDFNHESAATQYYVDRVTRFWLEEYHADGYRFDFTKGFTQNAGDGWELDADRIRILQRMADRQWAVDDSSYVILEHLAANEEETILSEYGMLLWGNANHAYNEATMGYHQNGKSDFSHVAYTDRGWDEAHLVGYMESHDEERLMYKNLQFGNSSGDYDITELNTGLNRNKMAAAFFFTIPGPKMIWQFGELGYDISIEQNGRTGEKPIKWEYYSDAGRKRLYNTFRALIRLRNAHPAFTSESSELTLELDAAVKRIAIQHPDMDVSIVGNFGVEAATARPGFTRSGSWYEYFSGDTLQVDDPDMDLQLAAGEFRIYTTRKFERPEEPIFAGGDTPGPGNGDGEPASRFVLHQNYPNPFRATTTIPYELPRDAAVRLQVFDILGKEVLQRDLGRQTAGKRKEIDVDLSRLSSGIYLYRVQAGSAVATRKMLLIK